jgi:hypothetical protein
VIGGNEQAGADRRPRPSTHEEATTMAMYAMTVTAEWAVNDGQLMLARAECEYAAEGSVAALAQAHDLLAALFLPPEMQPPTLWAMGQRPDATLAGVLAVRVRYLEPEDRAPRGFRCLLH